MNNTTKIYFLYHQNLSDPFYSQLQGDETVNCESIYEDFFNAPIEFKIRSIVDKPEKSHATTKEKFKKTAQVFLPKPTKNTDNEIKDLSIYTKSLFESPKINSHQKNSLNLSIEKPYNQSFSSSNIMNNQIKEEVQFECNLSDQVLFSDLLVKKHFRF